MGYYGEYGNFGYGASGGAYQHAVGRLCCCGTRFIYGEYGRDLYNNRGYTNNWIRSSGPGGFYAPKFTGFYN